MCIRCDFYQISKAAIKNYQIGRRVPHCGFELQLLSAEGLQHNFSHKVVVTGVSTLKTFYIRYPQTEGKS